MKKKKEKNTHRGRAERKRVSKFDYVQSGKSKHVVNNSFCCILHDVLCTLYAGIFLCAGISMISVVVVL